MFQHLNEVKSSARFVKLLIRKRRHLESSSLWRWARYAVRVLERFRRYVKPCGPMLI